MPISKGDRVGHIDGIIGTALADQKDGSVEVRHDSGAVSTWLVRDAAIIRPVLSGTSSSTTAMQSRPGQRRRAAGRTTAKRPTAKRSAAKRPKARKSLKKRTTGKPTRRKRTAKKRTLTKATGKKRTVKKPGKRVRRAKSRKVRPAKK